MSLLTPVRAARSTDSEELLRAALRCIARRGVTATTLDDVAAEAGCSRATAYRSFPGGKDGLVEAVAGYQLRTLLEGVDAGLRAATSLEDLLVAGIHQAGLHLLGDPALAYIRAHEPELLLPHMSFRGMELILAAVTAFASPHLERFLDPVAARRTAEWVTRIVLSFTTCPADHVDLADEASVRRLVRTFVLPGVAVS